MKLPERRKRAPAAAASLHHPHQQQEAGISLPLLQQTCVQSLTWVYSEVHLLSRHRERLHQHHRPSLQPRLYPRACRCSNQMQAE